MVPLIIFNSGKGDESMSIKTKTNCKVAACYPVGRFLQSSGSRLPSPFRTDLGLSSKEIWKKNQNGFSLIGLLMSLTGMAFFSLVVSELLVNSTKLFQVGLNPGTLIDTLHSNGMQYARNSDRLRNSILEHESGRFQNCLKQRGTGCMGFARGFKPLDDSSIPDLNRVFSVTNGFRHCKSTQPTRNCPILRKTEYRLVCGLPTACQGVEVKVETTYLRTGRDTKQFADRQGSFFISSLALFDRSAINFACSLNHGEFLTKIDYASLTGICEGFTGRNSAPSNAPLRIFATPELTSDYQVMENTSCSGPGIGLGTVGLFSGQSVCRGPQ